ncbi:alpha/beta hydrolase [Arthrobacter sp. I2-34]|uniref:Alpha/beta hydrolase n=1 Tax=Arthrobacter hankyongi TaxID=2904801 RepID=A0ABS9LA27_9MICC|nr:alpha/beta hydrolase [Arthrobacter hankyongi]MCG2623443.1 alpha/beta hydrolase [Arthrobacter hankyongi]
MVFLPGVNNVATLWEPVVESIEEPISPLLLDLPPLESVEAIAQELEAALPDRFVLVGHSFGGMVGLAMLEAFADRFAGIALVASRAGADSPQLRQAKLERAEAARRDGHEKFVLTRGDRVFHPDFAQDPKILAQREIDVRAYGTARYVAHQIAMANRPDRTQVLRDAGIPKLIIAPEDDVVIESAYQASLAEQVGAQLVSIERTGHMLPAENPTRLGQELGAWLSTVSLATAN